jgi:hypothetical protein
MNDCVKHAAAAERSQLIRSLRDLGINGDFAASARVTDAFVAAHRAGAAALRSGPGTFPVGLTLALPDTITHPDGDYHGEGMRLADMPTEGPMAAIARLMAGSYLEAARDDDFIGIQTYAETHINGTPQGRGAIIGFSTALVGGPSALREGCQSFKTAC